MQRDRETERQIDRETVRESVVDDEVCHCKVSDQSLDQYRVSPLTPPSETSSTFSPSERRESNDSQDIGRHHSEGRRRREGKDERLARIEGITEFITVDDIINLPMGRFMKIIAG